MISFATRFLRAKPTIDRDDEEWQLETWAWLLAHLGGLEALSRYAVKIPSRSDFPPSGTSGMEHVEFVFNQVARCFSVDPRGFDLEIQEADVDPHLAPLAIVQNAPQNPLGTYRPAENRHLVSVNPGALGNLEQLITTLAHEICHPILLAVPEEPPGGGAMEEHATDLAMVFFGFGIFGANSALVHHQYRDDATGTQGWSISRSGYLSQNEWGYALAVKHLLMGDRDDAWSTHLIGGAQVNYRKNLKYLRKNIDLIDRLKRIQAD